MRIIRMYWQGKHPLMKGKILKRIGLLLGGLLIMSVLITACNSKSEVILEGKKCFIDLHLHLDGSISEESAKELAEMQNIDIPKGDELKSLLSVSEDCKDLNEYLEKFAFPCSLLQTKEAISESVCNLMEELKAEGVIYAEIRFAPQKHKEQGLTQEEVVQAAIEGLKRGKLEGGLILCCMREEGNLEENLETVSLASKYLGKGVVAVDLAGAEALYPTKDFEKEFALAKELGVPYTIHAGEADGPESVKKALEFGAKRIGHGVRSTEDDELMETLAKDNIILECCPTSNIQTCVYDSIEEYPIRTFLERGVKFTINTDNLSVSATSLREEWNKVMEAFDLTEDEVKSILLNSVEAAFANEEIKEELRQKIEEEFRL